MNKKSIQQNKCLFTMFFAMCLCLFVTQAKAQNIPVTINMQNAKMVQVMNEIEKQTKYLFIYTDEVNINRTVNIAAKERPLGEILAQMLKDSNIAYEVKNSNIILSVKQQKPSAPVTVSGIVHDPDGQPVIGASVIVKGTAVGVSTGVDGSFKLQVPSPTDKAVLTVNYLGYSPMDVVIGGKTNIKITLQEESIQVDNVVVTALGIKRAEKALSYNVQTVAGDELTKVRDANFINSLSGKVAGVNINASSSGIGGASKVVMRGVKSILQSSNALYVIDGIPVHNFCDGGSHEFESQGSTDAMADLNPEDIESATILTGAAASALYGNSAANGAIIITTKKGKIGKAEVTLTSNTEFLSPFVLPEFQNKYGTGNYNSSVEVLDRSWGNELNSANYMGYNPRKDYFQTGIIGSNTISVSRGNENNQTYFSAGSVNSKGIVPNNKYDRYNFTIRNSSWLVDNKVTLDLSASYILQKDRNMINQGTYMNPLTSAYLFPRGNDWNDIKMYERWDSSRGIYTQYWPSGAGGSYVLQNPYWINYRNLRENDKDRYMFSAALDYKILDWLSVSGRIRIDNSAATFEEKLYASTNKLLTESSSTGLYGQTMSKDKQTYGDALININKTFAKNFSLQAIIGASFSDLRYKASKVRGPILDRGNDDLTPGIPNIFISSQLSGVKTHIDPLDWHQQEQSIFASAELGYKSTYFLTVTGRNDWPSQLAGPSSKNSSFFYPSVGLSSVISQIVTMPEYFSYLKVRASYASVGTPFQRYLALSTYQWNYSNNMWDTRTFYPMGNLKPERTKSWEIGITAKFLKNFNLDFSFYYTKTSNQTFDPGISASSKYPTMYIQSGDILNRGIELSLGYSNQWGAFMWNSTYTLSSNHNEILSIGENAYNPITGEKLDIGPLDVGGLGQARFVLKKGGSLGDLYSRTDLERDSNGDIYVDAKGDMQVVSSGDGNWIKLGSVLPKANMGWNNEFRYKNLSASFLLSARLGGIVFSRTQASLDYFGVSKATADARDRGGVWINGGKDRVDANKWYSTIADQDGVAQFYTYSATNVRLQEASIGYTIPKKKLGNIMSITISLVGRNLWMIYNKAPFDPEATAATDNYYQGIDYFMMPNTRNIGFNLKFKF